MAQNKVRSLGDKAYIKVWTAKKIADDCYQCRVTISRKNENKTENYPDEYITDFSGFVTFRNGAAKKISSCGLPEFTKKGDEVKPVNAQIASAVSIRGGSFSKKELEEYKRIIKICDQVPSADKDELVKYVKARAGRYVFTIWDINLTDDFNNTTSNKTSNSKKIDVDVDDDDDLPF